jgi:putative ABC transport system ATP-binding protein
MQQHSRMSDTTTEAVVRLRGVAKTYRSDSIEVAAVKSVDLDIRRNQFTMLVGPSGSGKTTLLNLIGCIDRPSEGSIEIAGRNVGTLNDTATTDFRSRHVGFVFQNFNLMPVLTAYENVEYPLLLINVPPAERRIRTLQLLEAVGLKDRHRQLPGQLSGGQKQRVAIARALVKRPDIVLADEPTANLDTQTGAALIELMREIQEKLKTTFIFSTHDPQLMLHADETVRIRDGQVVSVTKGQ